MNGIGILIGEEDYTTGKWKTLRDYKLPLTSTVLIIACQMESHGMVGNTNDSLSKRLWIDYMDL